MYVYYPRIITSLGSDVLTHLREPLIYLIAKISIPGPRICSLFPTFRSQRLPGIRRMQVEYRHIYVIQLYIHNRRTGSRLKSRISRTCLRQYSCNMQFKSQVPKTDKTNERQRYHQYQSSELHHIKILDHPNPKRFSLQRASPKGQHLPSQPNFVLKFTK